MHYKDVVKRHFAVPMQYLAHLSSIIKQILVTYLYRRSCNTELAQFVQLKLAKHKEDNPHLGEVSYQDSKLTFR